LLRSLLPQYQRWPVSVGRSRPGDPRHELRFFAGYVDFDGGGKWRPRTKRYGFEAGYKFLHISNAFTTSVDPGVDNNLYLCFSLYAESRDLAASSLVKHVFVLAVAHNQSAFAVPLCDDELQPRDCRIDRNERNASIVISA